jgi:SAM-dependent methyltransferase
LLSVIPSKGFGGRSIVAKRYSSVKTLDDGRAMLNLACGAKTSWAWNNLDFSTYALLAHHRTLASLLKRLGVLSSTRYKRLLGVDPGIIRHDLRKGIPFDSNTFDVVYHSHFLEHLDRGAAHLILRECYRVLKPGGILRVVVPDLHILIQNYNASFSALENGGEVALDRHLGSVEAIFDQMVRESPRGTTQQAPWVRMIERLLRGDAAKTGEVHRWMYDEYSLKALLSRIGFKDVRVQDARTSEIQGWNRFHLDINQDGSVYIPESLYVEGTK